jgi:transcriptional regulator with XRE-family HTH domain
MNQNTPNNPQKFSKEDRKRIMAEEGAILAFTEEMLRRMEELEISKTQLADKLDVEPAFISKLIGGENNFTIKTMVKIALALRSRINFALVPVKPKSFFATSSSELWTFTTVLAPAYHQGTYVHSGVHQHPRMEAANLPIRLADYARSTASPFA